MKASYNQLEFFDVEQNSDEWFALRLGRATASNFAAFMPEKEGAAFGEPAKRYALQLALEQITCKRATMNFSNDHTQRGHEQEPVARELYAQERFCEVANGGFFACGDYGASPDGLVGDSGIMEIKSVIAPVHYANIVRNAIDPVYRWQLVGELDCTGRAWIDFVSYCADFPPESQLFIKRLEREACTADIAKLRVRRAEFLGLVAQMRTTILAAGV